VLRRDKELAFLLCWVDDLEIRDLGLLSYFLGFEIHETSSGYVMKQTKYATELLARAGMSDCKPVATPMEASAHCVTHGLTFNSQSE
jgi:hypothetical protein